MTLTRTFAGAALGLMLSTHSLYAQDQSGYRNFPLGDDLPSIAALSGAAASEARTIHLRPAMMQELQWQRPYSSPADPVKQIVFSFYNDQLSKMVVDYDHARTQGMTDADLIAALSAEYGAQLKPLAKTGRGSLSQVEEESGTPIARWGGADQAVVLYRSSYAAGFRIIVTSPRLEALARTADAEASRMDEREAPQRELARQKKETEDARLSEEKARAANKAAFRP